MSLLLFVIVLSSMTPCSSEIVERDIQPCQRSAVYKIDVTVGDDVALKCIWSNPYYDALEWTLGNIVMEECNNLQQMGVCTTEFAHHSDRILYFRNVNSTFRGVYSCNFYFYSNLKCSKNVSVMVATLPTSPVPSTDYPITTAAAKTATELQSVKQTTTIVEDDWLFPTTKIISPASLGDGELGRSDETLDSKTKTIVALLASVFFLILAVGVTAYYLWLRRERSVVTASEEKKECRVSLDAYKHLEFDRNHLTLFEKLGEGHFGTVHRARACGIVTPGQNITVAVKMCKTIENNADETGFCEQSLCVEVELLVKIGSHNNVVKLLGMCSQGGPLWLIFEGAQLGNLLTYLRSARDVVEGQSCVITTNQSTTGENVLITQRKMFTFGEQIAKGMAYLYSQKILHRDLAARNVLVFNNEVLKMSDFGLARDIKYHEYYRRKTPCEMPAKWMSPEAIMHKVYTQASDVWSFGIVLWEIATLGGSPYPSICISRLYDLLVEGYRMSCPVNCPRLFHTIMLRCWEAEASERPTFVTLITMLSHPIEETKIYPPAVGQEFIDSAKTACH
ncbi:fibroblast growth factor receptor 2-like isoform X2 [Corticium candelabrum]|uniref:fibroblast growth factor receptor 2-like isoform X2 n=1 Tax=Corticium candelabrum TaxID=121492 RepID=UPI002E272EA5|nr:fibroblast growth factor receptor 2-like isoform X2 [Corticium candelabrum]